MNIFNNPYIFYKSEDTQTWIDNSIKLGRLAAEGDEKAKNEIKHSIIYTENIHTVRHSHLGLIIWWANSKNGEDFNFIQNHDIKEYIFGILTKNKSLKLNKNLFDSWIASAIMIGFSEVIKNNKISLDELINFLFTDANSFVNRLEEQGILQSIISCISTILEQNDNISLEQIKRIKKIILGYIISSNHSFLYSKEFIETSSKFILLVLRYEIKKTNQNREVFVSLVSDFYRKIIKQFTETKSEYYVFLLDEVIDKSGIKIDDNSAKLVTANSIFASQLDWNITDTKNKSTYKNWLIYATTKTKNNSYINNPMLSYVIIKAFEKLQSDLSTELGFVNRAVDEFGVSSNKFYPFLRGLKGSFKQERKKYEDDIINQVTIFDESKKKQLNANKLNSLNSTIKQYKKIVEFQVYYMIKLTKTYSPINDRLFKDISSIIIDNIQSTWLIFKMLYDCFKEYDNQIQNSNFEILSIVKEGFHKEVYTNIFRILSSNLQTKLFKTMKDFCLVDEVKEIVILYENLSEYYYLNEDNFNIVLKKLDDLLDYLPDSLRIYNFLQIDIEMTYQPFLALKRIIFEKKWIDFLLQNNIAQPLNNDIYITEYSKNEIYTDRSILFLQDTLSNWQNNRERLFRDVEMDYKERIELLQKNLILLGELNKSLQELLPTAVYFVHSWVIKKEEERTNQELSTVKLLINKKENEIALLIDNLLKQKTHQKTELENDLTKMTLLLSFQYAVKTMQKPLAKKLKNYKKICAQYIEKYNISFKNSFQFKFNTILISGMLLTVGIGYIAPFIMGGNNDFWAFFHDANWLSIIISSIFMALLSQNKIKQIVQKKVGVISQYDLYGKFTIKKRIRFLFKQGLIFAYIIVILGLLVYHPYIKTNLNFTNILLLFSGNLRLVSLARMPTVAEGTFIDTIETVCKYLTVFPFTTLFIGLFLENKLED